MGSHTATYAAVALAITLVSLLAGFFWGRSNVKSQIEAALEKASASLDAREFAMRQQLDEAFAEVSRLRPLAEELGGVQERLKREQSKYNRMKAEFNASASNPAELVNEAEPEPESAASADEAIQKLLQSLEVFNAPDNQAVPTPEAVVVPQPAKIEPVVPPAPKQAPVAQSAKAAAPPPPQPARSPQPAAGHQPAQQPAVREQARPAAPQPQRAPAPEPRKAAMPSAKPAPLSPPNKVTAAPQPKSGQKVDEWQEFARQLEALTGKKK